MKVGFMGLRDAYRKIGWTITYLFWIVILLFFAKDLVNAAQANLIADRQMSGPFDAPSTEMFNFFKAATPPDSVIVFFKPRAMRLMTDRNAITVTHCDQFRRGNFAVFLKGETMTRSRWKSSRPVVWKRHRSSRTRILSPSS